MKCPFKIGQNVSNKDCEKEKCAWWIKATDNKYNDCSGCAIKLIAEK